jgi:hypothetical protein
MQPAEPDDSPSPILRLIIDEAAALTPQSDLVAALRHVTLAQTMMPVEARFRGFTART